MTVNDAANVHIPDSASDQQMQADVDAHADQGQQQQQMPDPQIMMQQMMQQMWQNMMHQMNSMFAQSVSQGPGAGVSSAEGFGNHRPRLGLDPAAALCDAPVPARKRYGQGGVCHCQGSRGTRSGGVASIANAVRPQTDARFVMLLIAVISYKIGAKQDV